MSRRSVRLGLVGSRGFNDYQLLSDTILNQFDLEHILRIVSGGAEGADTLAARFANDHKIQLEELIPDWNYYGRSAGFVRNELIAKSSDIVVAFWDGTSKGTQNTIDHCRWLGVPIQIVLYNESSLW